MNALPFVPPPRAHAVGRSGGFIVSLNRAVLRSAMLLCICWGPVASGAAAAGGHPQTPSPSQALAEYFEAETARLAARCLADVNTLEDWRSRRAEYRRQAAEMLGLWPEPPRGDLKAVVTGTVEQEDFRVQKLHYQSSPGLYVTANLYLPKGLTRPAPAVLYVCGHGPVITNGISYGNKVSYQHHGIWFARNGYACLLIDTLQLGEIQGAHHGTYRDGAWWWNARGYTPAGVEAWNSIRALDYLCSRPEVDTNRLGVTGRSGGGAYSWTLAALDDRVKVIAPVAGITDLRNHVVDGVVEGHCDCMFLVNTYRWDYPLLAALAAPRPLLLVNTDADTIFPLDGVLRTHERLKRLYALHKAPANLGLVIAPGPHKDTQDLQMPVFRWFNRHLKGEDTLIEMAATKRFTPQQLKVFSELPSDAINTNAQRLFGAPPAAVLPPTSAERHAAWLAELRRQSFAGWPEGGPAPILRPLFRESAHGVVCEAYDLETQPHVILRLYVMSRSSAPSSLPVLLRIHGANQPWQPLPSPRASTPAARLAEVCSAFGLEDRPSREWFTDAAAIACVWPRGLGPDAWPGDARKQIHLRRRFMLLGQTLDSMRVWDIRRAVQAARELKPFKGRPLQVVAEGDLAVDALYASLFEKEIDCLRLRQMPRSHLQGPDYLNVLKVLDIPHALEMAAARCRVLTDGPSEPQTR